MTNSEHTPLLRLMIAITRAEQAKQMNDELHALAERFADDEMDKDDFIAELAMICISTVLTCEMMAHEAVTAFNPALALELAKIRSEAPDGSLSAQLQSAMLNLHFNNS